MKIGSGWKPIGLTIFVLGVMLTLAAVFGTGRGSVVYQHAAEAVPIEMPSRALSVPDAAYDDTLTAQEWTAWAALIGALTGAGSLLVLMFTLLTTRDMLEEARKTTRAALETVAATREVGQAQVRASLGYSRPAIKIKGQTVELCLHIKNTGYSAAHSFGVSDLSLELRYSDLDPPVVVVSNRSNVSANTLAAISPGESTERRFGLQMTEEETNSLSNCDWLRGIFVVGRGVLSFKDGFNTESSEGFLILGHILPGVDKDFRVFEFATTRNTDFIRKKAAEFRSMVKV